MIKKQTKKKERVDQLLFDRGLTSSVKEAQALVYAGKVHTKNKKIIKPSELLEKDTFLGLKEAKSSFASRGGDKLLSALQELKLEKNFKDKVVLDLGSSTGGFTDCALKHGAKKIIALDVGLNQLSWQLRKDERVISIEKTNLKDFDSEAYPIADIILADISFNSLEKLSPFISAASKKENLELLLLVKPQFELPRDLVPEKGVVTKQEDRERAFNKVQKAFEEKGFEFLGRADSKTKGRTGNQETFIYLKRKSAP